MVRNANDCFYSEASSLGRILLLLISFLLVIAMCGVRVRRERVRHIRRDLCFISPVQWNCLVGHSGPPSTAGSLTSAGTSLLDYKRGVPVARPREEVWEAEMGRTRRSRNTLAI
jgi:hypothetical protein